MKSSHLVTAFVCATSLSFSPGLFAAPSPTPTPTAEGSPANVVAYNGFLLGSKIIGSDIKNMQNENIGTISNLVVNPDTGRVRFAVLSVGGFLGLGDTEVVVPWGAVGLEKNAPGKAPSYVVNATKSKLEKAPRFDANKLTELYTQATAQPIFDYFDIIYFDDVPVNTPAASPSPSPKSTK